MPPISGIPSGHLSMGLARPLPGQPSLDKILRDGHFLQEVLAAPGQVCTAAAFCLALIAHRQGALEQRASGTDGAREIAWLQQEAAVADAGEPLGQGLAAFGIDPGQLIFVRLRTGLDVLRAGLEAARCSALGAVIIELVKPIDLTASRRLKLAAEKSGVPLLLLRHADASAPHAAPNAAQVRWRVGAAFSASVQGGEKSHGWGQPTFDVTVLKHPAGLSQTRFLIEWNRDQHAFAPALPWSVATVPVGRPLAA